MSSMQVRFPRYRAELLSLAEADQQEIQAHSINTSDLSADRKRVADLQLAKNCQERGRKAMEILRRISAPTVKNIGLEGSQALALLALHSYVAIMEDVLRKFEQEFVKEPSNIYKQAIPPLYDRIMILKTKNQLFGTNWMTDENGHPFLISVKDFKGVNERRKQYGLRPVKRPVDLATGAKKYPLGKGLAQEGDQKALSANEYHEYSRYYLEPII